jgi:hypothetical protein
LPSNAAGGTVPAFACVNAASRQIDAMIENRDGIRTLLPIDQPSRANSPANGSNKGLEFSITLWPSYQYADALHPGRVLRLRHEWPPSRAAEPCNEFTSSHPAILKFQNWHDNNY